MPAQTRSSNEAAGPYPRLRRHSPFAARAEQPVTPLVAFLGATSASALGSELDAFIRGLEETGYANGRNLVLEYRWAEGRYDRLPAVAAELVNLKPKVIVAATFPAALAAKAAIAAIPIVFFSGGDPVEQGLVTSFNHPGGNLTGACAFINELGPKRLGLLREIAPDATPVGFLANPAIPTNFDFQVKQMHEAARASGIEVISLPAATPSDIDAAFVTLAARHGRGVVVGADPFFGRQAGQILALSNKYRMPAIAGRREYAAEGGVVAYGNDLAEAYRRVGGYTGQVLKGAKPADLPVIRSTKFELFNNLKSAKALGLTVPQLLLVQADEVTE